MQIERLTATALAILEALATYRFLTTDQMMRLGVTKAKAHLYATLRDLKKRRPAVFVELDFGVLPTKGRLPRIYTLTKEGAELLIEAERTDRAIVVSSRTRLFPNDYFHRIACVDFHIALTEWARRTGTEIARYKSYYDPWDERGGKRAPSTRVPLSKGVVDPDAVFFLTPPDGVRRLFAFEMCCGRKTKYVEDKLTTYLKALDEEAIETALIYDEGAVRVLLIFDRGDATSLELVLKRAASQPRFDEFSSYFFAKTLDEVEREFVGDWRHFDGQVVPLFQSSRKAAVA